MRIAVVHSFYSSSVPSGENEIVLKQVEILRRHGHEVLLIGRSTDEMQASHFYPLASGIRVITGRGSFPLADLNSFEPDVIHVHNLFPNFGTSWLTKTKVPIVVTVHNYRNICANGLFFRDGKPCFECLEGSKIAAVIHACYRDSSVASVPLAIRNSRGLDANPLFTIAKKIQFLNSQAASIHVANGLDSKKVVVIPNGLADSIPRTSDTVKREWVYVGRLTREKGIQELLQVWPREMHLNVVGSGELEKQLRADSKENIHFLGSLPNETVKDLIATAQGVLIPSQCLEMQPTVAIEALQFGVPVVAHRNNAAATLITEYECGATYVGLEDISIAIDLVNSERNHLSKNARHTFERLFSETTWLENQLAEYRKAHHRGITQ